MNKKVHRHSLELQILFVFILFIFYLDIKYK